MARSQRQTWVWLVVVLALLAALRFGVWPVVQQRMLRYYCDESKGTLNDTGTQCFFGG